MRTYVERSPQTAPALPTFTSRPHQQSREAAPSLGRGGWDLSGVPVQERPRTGNGGLPDPLRQRMEQLSGVDMSAVKVEWNSDRPEKMNALAYTDGSKIFVGPGQERHLAHETWHVVQQSQSRIRPTKTINGTAINDDIRLEREADTMAAMATSAAPFADRSQSRLSVTPTPARSVIQRTIGDGHDLTAPWFAGNIVLEAVYDNERLLQSGSSGTAVRLVQQLLFYLGFDLPSHGADGIFGSETESAVEQFQAANVDEAGTALVVDGIIGPLTMGSLNNAANRTGTNIGNLIRTSPLAALQAPPANAPGPGAPPISVDRIDIVDSGTGAIGGYPAIVGGADLNAPGPFEDAATGETRNTHQIHFHLDNGNSANLTPRRELQRTSVHGGVTSNNPSDQPLPAGVAGPPVPGGFTGVLVGPDGPPAHEIQRPNANSIVIADSPGLLFAASGDFPISYRSHFFLVVENAAGAPIARILYDVEISRTSLGNVPAAQNSIVSVEKKDFVRGRNL